MSYVLDFETFFHFIDRDFQNEEGEQSFSMNYHTLANNADGDAQNSPQSSAQNKSKTTNADKPVPKPRNPLRRSLSAQHRATKVLGQYHSKREHKTA